MDPKLVRPKLWWIAAGWGVALVCVLAGAVLFVTSISSTVGDLAPTTTFAAGESVTVPINPVDKPVIYLASATRVHYTCQISGGPSPARLANTPTDQTVTIGSTRWQLILAINAPAQGDYQLTCATQEQADARFGVGRDASSAAGGLVGGVAALLLIPGLGLLVGIVVTIVVLVRRSGSRKRLAMAG
ncbi:YccF domain-containing protein [Nonomuraea cavernae]|uniref:YccF domain-containing protein n=1 Tax=Nonomuraea cavernae TaxID=2045107 RepID=UPI0033CEFD57